MSDLDDLEEIADANRRSPNRNNPRPYSIKRGSIAAFKRNRRNAQDSGQKHAKFHQGRRKAPITLAPIGGSK